jgi:hypothetical protein
MPYSYRPITDRDLTPRLILGVIIEGVLSRMRDNRDEGSVHAKNCPSAFRPSR